MHDSASNGSPSRKNWQAILAPYQTPKLSSSLWQIVNTFTPFIALLYLMYLSLGVSYWLTLLLSIPTGGLLTRIFILFHDCGHGSFFTSQRANNIVGIICGLVVFTPYYQWRYDHAIHHATSGDLDRRGTGDITTLTIKEYLALSRWGRLKYRLYRSPVVLLGFGPWYNFVISQRFISPNSRRRERMSVHFSNAAIGVLLIIMWATIGIPAFLLIYLPVAFFGGLGGIWLFYVQHQFEGTYWATHDEWDYATAALQGSSYFKLPKVLQWFTGNIGFHHIHHLSARIPNYALQRCMMENPEFMDVTTITLRSSLKSLRLNLWDEDQRQLVSFGYLKQLSRQQQRMA
jgi:omega-6 fatty acid desaturase (delta-12 desaturase)